MARKKQELNRDYVERGSERHAAILGLIADPESPLKWRLADPTQFGPNATPAYLTEALRQKVSSCSAGSKSSSSAGASMVEVFLVNA